MKKSRRIRTVEEQLEDLRTQVSLLAGTVEKLVQVVTTTKETAPAASEEGLAERIPY